jgi:septation ring formation regulator EzrA
MTDIPVDIAISKNTLKNILYELDDISKELERIKDRLDSIYNDIEEEMGE